MKVVLFTNALPARGALLASDEEFRAAQLEDGLRAAGIDVTVAAPDRLVAPDAALGSSKAPGSIVSWGAISQAELIEELKPEAVIFAGSWEHYALPAKPSVPLILDLALPAFAQRIHEPRSVSSEKKVRVLSLADCLITGSRRQRAYFAGWLVQAGRVPTDSRFISVVPPATEIIAPSDKMELPKEPRFVSFGGFSAIEDHRLALLAVAELILERRIGSLELSAKLVGDMGSRIRALADDSAGRIKVSGERRELRIKSGSVAIQVASANVYQDLTISPRAVALLGRGVPLIYNNYSELSERIWEYDAGWVVDPENQTELNAVLEEVFAAPLRVREKSEGALTLARERFAPGAAIEPLLDFLRNPQTLVATEPVLGAAYPRPTPLAANGEPVTVLVQSNTTLRQRFVLPQEGVAAIELQLLGADTDEIPALRARLLRLNGSVVVDKTFLSREHSPEGYLNLKLPAIFPPHGGEELLLEVRSKNRSHIAAGPDGAIWTVGFQALAQSIFPLRPLELVRGSGDALETAVPGSCLHLRFIPLEASSTHRAKLVMGRALEMLRRGELLRAYRAASRRLPQVFETLKRRGREILAGG